MVPLQLLFGLATIVGILLLRRQWPQLESRTFLPLAVSGGLAVWALAAVVLLSRSVPELAAVHFQWGAIGKILGFGTLFVWPILAVPTRWARHVAGLLVILLCFIGFSDLVYHRHFGNLIPLTAFLGVGQTWAIRESIGSLMRWHDLWLLPTAIAGVAVMILMPTPHSPVPVMRRNRRLTLGITAAMLLPGLGMVAYNLNHSRTRKVLSHARLMRHLGSYSTHVVDAARVVRESWNKHEATPDQLRETRDYLARCAVEQAMPRRGPLFGVARGASVLAVQLESVQSFVIGLRIGDQEVTPYLNSLTTEAAYFSLITDQTGESNTADTEYLVHNSQHPMRQGAVVFRRPENDFIAVPQLLRSAGYVTVSAHPWNRGFWNRAVVHPRYGFERTLFRRELGGVIDRVGWGTSDPAFYKEMVPVLADTERPHFTYLITLMSHHPYLFYPERRKRLDMGELEGTMLGAYLHLMHEVDFALRDFIDELDTRGALDNTMLVFLGDHDARLQTPRSMIGAAVAELGLEVALIRQIGLRDPRADFVPVFIKLPGNELRGEIATAGGQIDVGSTLLYLLGIEQPPIFLGRPLLPGASGFAARVDGSVLTNNRFYVSQGVDVPARGLCLGMPARDALPLAACAGLMERGAEQVQASWRITELNMAAALGRSPPDTTVEGATR
ncbi:LTA synthase family protein [Myxococcota bacterium]